MKSPFINQVKSYIPTIRSTAKDDPSAVATAQAIEGILKIIESIPDSTENTDAEINVLEGWRLG